MTLVVVPTPDETAAAAWAQVSERLRERLPARREKDKELALAIISLGVSIPLIAIAGSAGGLPAVVAVCCALVLVNYLFRN